jgi:hypothetical protein
MPALRSPAAALAAAGFLASACGGGGGGGGGDAAPGPNATWITDAGAFNAPAVAPVDTTSPHHVIPNGTNAQMIAALQAALEAHTTGGIITFATTTPVTLTLSQAFYIPYATVLDTTPRPIVVDGKGLVTLDGNNATRILQKGYRIDLTVQNLAFVNGRVGADAADDLPAESGAAVNVEDWDGRLTAIDCTFTNCVCTEDGPDRGGGAIRAAGQRHVVIAGCTFTGCSGSNGGAVNTLGSQLTVVDCTFTGNSAHGSGGGADAGPGGQGGIGGAIYTDGVNLNADAPRSVLSRCTFRNNTAGDHAGAVFNYTIPGTGSVSVVSRCTFDNNSVPEPGTFYVGSSGALYTQGADTSIVDSTFSGNSAPLGGGAVSFHTDRTSRVANCTFSGNRVRYDAAAHTGSVGGAVAMYNATPFYFSHCTFAGNRAGNGAAIFNGTGVRFKSCAFADNLGAVEWNGHTVWATAIDGGGNVQWPRIKDVWGTNDTPATATVVWADPLLGPLQDNGGPTWTRRPANGSPARDAGSASEYPPTDQRGQPRPLGAGPDAGSVESP